MAHAHKPRLSSNHFSAQVLFKTCTSYSWEHHPSLVGTANPSRLQPGSVGAQGRSNLCLHYAQAIDYFHCLSLPICGHCSGAIMGKHHLFHSLNEDCTVILTDQRKYNHPPSLLYKSPILTRLSAPLFQSGKDEHVSGFADEQARMIFSPR